MLWKNHWNLKGVNNNLGFVLVFFVFAHLLKLLSCNGAVNAPREGGIGTSMTGMVREAAYE
jgi:hypothetical protein